MAEFLYKIAGFPPYTPTSSDYSKIKDLSKVGNNEPRKLAIAWLVTNNISILDKSGNYNPSNPVNRGSMAEFMMKLYKLYVS
jgi:hypothetical protein